MLDFFSVSGRNSGGVLSNSMIYSFLSISSIFFFYDLPFRNEEQGTIKWIDGGAGERRWAKTGGGGGHKEAKKW